MGLGYRGILCGTGYVLFVQYGLSRITFAIKGSFLVKNSFFTLSMLIVFGCFFIIYPIQAQNDSIQSFSASQTEDGIEIYRLSNGEIAERLTLLENIYLERANVAPTSNNWTVKNFQDFSSSSDGRYIAFTAYQGEQSALFIYNIWESTLQQTLIPFSKRPIWSPDSQRIWLKSVEAPFQDMVYDLSENMLFDYWINHSFWMPNGSN